MEEQQAQTSPSSTGFRRIFRFVKKTILWLLLVVIVLFVLILTPPVQNFITGRATSFLEKKIGTRVEIKRLFLTLNGRLAIDGLYLEDQHRDTLLSAGSLRVSANLYKLIFNGDVEVGSVEIEGLIANVLRRQADSVFNYQYIIDAFAGVENNENKSSSSGSSGKIKLGKVSVNGVNVRYADALEGDDYRATWKYFSTDLGALDLTGSEYVIGATSIKGLRTQIDRNGPVVEAIEQVLADSLEINDTVTGPPLLIKLHQLRLDDCALLYADAISNMNMELNTQSLVVSDLSVSPTYANYSFRDLSVLKTNFKLDDNTQPKTKTGIDYAHLNTDIEEIKIGNAGMQGDSIYATVHSIALKETSGLDIKRLMADVVYAPTTASLKNLELTTAHSRLRRDVSLSYNSFDELTNRFEDVVMDLDLSDTRVRNSDILLFAPMLAQQEIFADPQEYWLLNTQLKGTLKNLQAQQLKLEGPDGLKLALQGNVRNLMDPGNIAADITLSNVYATRSALQSFIPKGQLPENIQLPEWMSVKGKVNGNAQQMLVNLGLTTDKGDLHVDGTVRNAGDEQRMSYDMQLEAKQFNLGYILKDTMFGNLQANLRATGIGMNVATMRAELSGEVESFDLNGYKYQNIPLKAGIANQQASFSTQYKDPNLHFAIDGSADLSKEFPSFKLTGQIDSAKLQPTNWTSEPWIVRTSINADFVNIDPDNLEGRLYLTQLLLVNERERLNLDTVAVMAGKNENGNFLQLQSDLAEAAIAGNYKLTQIGSIIQQQINKYYSLDIIPSSLDPYNFTVTASVNDRPMLRTLIPDLQKADGVRLISGFSDSTGMQLKLFAREINYDGNVLKGLFVDATTADSALLASVQINGMQSGSFQIDSTILQARLANNQINWSALLKDAAHKDRYNIAGKVVQNENGDVVINMNPDNLRLNYDKWQMASDNIIRIGANGSIWASNFELKHEDEVLRLNNETEEANSPLDLSLRNFRASTLTAIALSDSTLVDGRLTGDIKLRNLAGTPVFSGEIKWDDLSYKSDTVGNLTARFSNQGNSQVILADVQLAGRGNEASVKGVYNAANSTVDLNIDLSRLPLRTAEAFSGGMIRNTKGYVSGPFQIKGPVSEPNITGQLGFYDAGLNVAMLNSFFSINNEKLLFTGESIRFDEFQVKDSLGNELLLDGEMQTSNFINYKFNLDIRARNFQALNSTKKDNKLFWGLLFFNTNLKLKGTELKPVLDGRLTINDKTKMTVVLPQSEPGMVERAGVIEFVDMDAPVNDSLFLAAYDSMNVADITGMDVSLNITVDKGADFTLIIDEGNGDFLNVKGEAQLNAGIDPSGKITMVGTYELEQGSYELSFNMLRKKFDIQKGSKIVWEGEPTSANVDIEAKYIANTAPLDLVKGQLDEDISPQERNMYLQRLPFDVVLKMEGQLLRPLISFNIQLPENKSYGVSNDILTNVRTKLEQLRQSTGDMNKQVFSLLLLNRFVAENPFNMSGSSTSNMLRQSVSKLLTEQLNRLAEGLIEGVDINLGVESRDDYSSGEKEERTDLNVGLSKRLLNDRLTVTVGSNFALEGPQQGAGQSNNIAGNVAIDYTLSRDGRYKLRAYRKNDYQGIIDGVVVETGMSFIITVDYNQFKQIFQKRRKRPETSPAEKEKPATEPDQVPKAATKPEETGQE